MQTPQFTACLRYVSEGMIASEPRLTALDQVIGDGDHGIGIKRGFTALHMLLSSAEFAPADIGECLLQSGTRLMTSMGGASGAIFGTLFRAGGKALAGREEFDAATLAEWLEIGMTAIHQRGGPNPVTRPWSMRWRPPLCRPKPTRRCHCRQLWRIAHRLQWLAQKVPVK